MKTIKLLLLALTLSFSQMGFAQDSYGTDFWLAVPRNYNGGSTVQLYVTAQNAASVTVEVAGLSFSTTVAVAANTLSTITIPTTVQISTGGTSNLGIHVTSTSDITAYLMNQITFTTDAHLVLPVDALGNEYYVMSYTPGFNPTYISIVATENGTTVDITPKVANSNGLTVNAVSTVNLNEGQVYTVRSSSSSGASGDLTGSYISSNKPVAVISASGCAQVPFGTPFCDYLVEQMTPTTSWGSNFVTVPLGARTSGDVFRILANTAGTQISIDGVLVSTIGVGQFFETTLASGTYHRINTNNPVLVGQFAKGGTSDGTVSDPFFALVPPDDQFITSYIISSGTPNISNNYVNIISPNSNLSNVQFDGTTVTSGLWNAIAGTNFSGAVVGPFTNGVHTISSVLPIGVMAYGWGDDDSYGYLGGQSFSPVATVSSFSLNLSQTTAIQAQQKCVIATVLDQNNDPVVGVLVNFNVSGANAGAAGFGNTNAQGQVTLCYNVCQPGNDTLIATIAGLADSVVIVVAPSTLSVLPTNLAATAGVQSCVIATVLDGSNIPVQGAVVNFTVTGTNAATMISIATNAQGEAQFCYTPANAGSDVINISAGCTGGNTANVSVVVTGGGGTPCINPGTVTITSPGLNKAWKGYGASDPYTFYYGVANSQRLNASVSGGVGPYTYQWSNSGSPSFLLARTYYPASSVDLVEPTGPIVVTCTVTDLGNNNCQYVGTRSFNWSDEFYCYKVGFTWYIRICQNGITSCVPWNTARALLQSNQATLGACVLKTETQLAAGSLTLYPNPSNGLLNIGTYIAKAGEGSLMVMDMRGNTIQAEALNFTEGIWEQTLELNHLASGTYIIRLQTVDNVITERFQIVN